MLTSAVLVAALAATTFTWFVTIARLRRARGLLAAAERRASTDPLTGLANRRTFITGVEASLCNRPAVSVALIDVDQLKGVNDHHGHATGDAVLVEIAARLGRLAAPVVLAARLSGDEFAVLIHGDLDHAYTAACSVWHAIADRPVIAGRLVLPVRASIGLACGLPEMSAGQLLHRADLAMYRAKATGTGVYGHTGDLPDEPAGGRPAYRARDLPRPRPLPDPRHHHH